MHPTTFEYQRPTEAQMAVMSGVRAAFSELASALERMLPPGPDKTYSLRHLRETAMWANVAITREADGSPRS